MIADILPEEQRAEGFGILRVVGNLAWIIGPTIGGFVATRSFFMLFVIDSVFSCIVAVIFYKFMPETKPEAPAGKSQATIWQTVGGYRLVLRDFAFMAFLIAAMFMAIVYQQMYGYPVGLLAGLPRDFDPGVWISADQQRHHRGPVPILGDARHQT